MRQTHLAGQISLNVFRTAGTHAGPSWRDGALNKAIRYRINPCGDFPRGVGGANSVSLQDLAMRSRFVPKRISPTAVGDHVTKSELADTAGSISLPRASRGPTTLGRRNRRRTCRRPSCRRYRAKSLPPDRQGRGSPPRGGCIS